MGREVIVKEVLIIKETIVVLRTVVVEIRELENRKILGEAEKEKLVQYKKKFNNLKRKVLYKQAVVKQARKGLKKARGKIVRKMSVLKDAEQMSKTSSLKISVNKSVIDTKLVAEASTSIEESGVELEAELLLKPKSSVSKASEVVKKTVKVLGFKKKVIAVLKIVIEKIVVEITRIEVIIKEIVEKREMNEAERIQLRDKKTE